MQQFIYTPIRAADEIRVLKCLPQTTNMLSYEIKHVNYSSHPYQALSYCWGEDSSQHTIRIDGKICCVRENLWRFLKNTSEYLASDRVPYIWIDALCINQDDENEKTAQVAFMRKIYESATQVLTWLGEDQVLFELFSYLQSEPWEPVKDPFAWPPGVDLSGEADRRLAILAEHDYWYRLWIIQEVVVPRSPPQLLCRNLRVSWNQLFAKIYTSRWLHVEKSSGHNRFLSNKLWSVMLVRREFQMLDSNQNDSETGYRITATAESSKCSDRKDRIFGIIGLVQPFTGRTIMPGTYGDDITMLACKALLYYPHYFELERLVKSLDVGTQGMLGYLSSLEGCQAESIDFNLVELRERHRARHVPFWPDERHSCDEDVIFPTQPRWTIRLSEYVKLFVDFRRQTSSDEADAAHCGSSLEVSVRQDASIQTWIPDAAHQIHVHAIFLKPGTEICGKEATGTIRMPVSTFAWIFKVGIKAFVIQQQIVRIDAAMQNGDEYAGLDLNIEGMDIAESVCRFEYGIMAMNSD